LDPIQIRKRRNNYKALKVIEGNFKDNLSFHPGLEDTVSLIPWQLDMHAGEVGETRRNSRPSGPLTSFRAARYKIYGSFIQAGLTSEGG